MKHIYPIIAAIFLCTFASAQLTEMNFELTNDDKTASAVYNCGDHGFFIYNESRVEGNYDCKVTFHNTKLEKAWEQTLASSEGLMQLQHYQVDPDGTIHLLLGTTAKSKYAIYSLSSTGHTYALVAMPDEEFIADFIACLCLFGIIYASLFIELLIN